jgi:hypothetical protein
MKIISLNFRMAGFVFYLLASGQISLENNNNRLASQLLNELYQIEKIERRYGSPSFTCKQKESGPCSFIFAALS